MTEKIKRCPFCGGEFGGVGFIGHPAEKMYGFCADCGATGPTIEYACEEIGKAVEQWDQRHLDPRIEELIEAAVEMIPYLPADDETRKPAIRRKNKMTENYEEAFKDGMLHAIEIAEKEKLGGNSPEDAGIDWVIDAIRTENEELKKEDKILRDMFAASQRLASEMSQGTNKEKQRAEAAEKERDELKTRPEKALKEINIDTTAQLSSK